MEKYQKETLLSQDEDGEIWLSCNKESGHKAVQHLFYRETVTIKIYRALQKIHQKNLPEILDIQSLDSGISVWEEYIEGVPIGDLLSGGRVFTGKEVCACALQLCAALKTLHQNGIIHRDVKPGNLIMRPSGTIVLIDFDASRFYNPYQEKDTMVLGTQGYAAPEQYGFSQTDFRADIYALGITLKELLPPRGDCGLQRILKKCIAVDPNRRYQTIAQLERAIQWKSLRKAAFPAVIAAAAICLVVLLIPRSNTPVPQSDPSPGGNSGIYVADERLTGSFIKLDDSHYWNYPQDGDTFTYAGNEFKLNDSFTLGPYGDSDDAFLLTSPSRVRDITFSGADSAFFSAIARAERQADGTWQTRILFLKQLPSTEEKTYLANATLTFDDEATMTVHCSVKVIDQFILVGDNPTRDYYVGVGTEISVMVIDEVPDTHKYAYTWKIVDGQDVAGFAPVAGGPDDQTVTHGAKEGKSDSVTIYGHKPGKFTLECMARGLVNGKQTGCGYRMENATVHPNETDASKS